jgi:hypothetical protein
LALRATNSSGPDIKLGCIAWQVSMIDDRSRNKREEDYICGLVLTLFLFNTWKESNLKKVIKN